jgi:hypothetical protein
MRGVAPAATAPAASWLKKRRREGEWAWLMR